MIYFINKYNSIKLFEPVLIILSGSMFFKLLSFNSLLQLLIMFLFLSIRYSTTIEYTCSGSVPEGSTVISLDILSSINIPLALRFLGESSVLFPLFDLEAIFVESMSCRSLR